MTQVLRGWRPTSPATPPPVARSPKHGVFIGLGRWGASAYSCGTQWAKVPLSLDGMRNPTWRWLSLQIGHHDDGRRTLRVQTGADGVPTLVLDTGEDLPLSVTAFDPLLAH